ncbi:MAG: response regulator [Planctomycetes bacterium]|nr:response regulator [Planctomycetota bacterium]
MRALVVDDSKAMRVILSQILRDLHFEVLDACDGLDAVKKLEGQGPIELALVDWNMPNMKGIDFVRHVREQNLRPEMRIVMVTTETEMDYVQQALTAGADEYVMKPFTKDVILEKLGLIGIQVR